MKVYYFAPFFKQDLAGPPTRADFGVGFSRSDGWKLKVWAVREPDVLAIDAHGAKGKLLLYARTREEARRGDEEGGEGTVATLDPYELYELLHPYLHADLKTLVLHVCDSVDFGRALQWYLGDMEVWAMNRTLIGGEYWSDFSDHSPFVRL